MNKVVVILVTLADSEGHQKIWIDGCCTTDGKDIPVVDALLHNSETVKVTIECFDADEFNAIERKGDCRSLLMLTLSGDTWRKLESDASLSQYMRQISGQGMAVVFHSRQKDLEINNLTPTNDSQQSLALDPLSATMFKSITLPWAPMVLPSLDPDSPAGKSIGTLFCADGDGLWTVLIVRPGEEQKAVEVSISGNPDPQSSYGFGWSKVGNCSHVGAYLFNQYGLMASVYPDPLTSSPVENLRFIEMALLMAETRMESGDPLLFAHLACDFGLQNQAIIQQRQGTGT